MPRSPWLAGTLLMRRFPHSKMAGGSPYPEGVMPEPEARSEVTRQSYNGLPGREAFERLNRLIEQEPFEVHLAQTFPLEQVAEAHGRLNEHFLGKLAPAPASITLNPCRRGAFLRVTRAFNCRSCSLTRNLISLLYMSRVAPG